MFKTRLRYGLVLLTAVSLFLFYHNFFFFYLLLSVILFPFISLAVSIYVWKRIDVDIEIKQFTVLQNNDITVDFITNNSSILSFPAINVEYKVENHFYRNDEIQIMTLPGRTHINKYSWNIKSVYAGQVEIKGINIFAFDYLGIFRFCKNWDYCASVSVLPKQSGIFMSVIGNYMTEGEEEEYNESNSVEDVTQVKEFRQYKPGDRLQRVNWKISARYDDLYVKEFEREYNRTIILLIELKKDEDKPESLDDRITAFYSAAMKLLDLDYKFKIQWYDIENSHFCYEFVENEEDLISTVQEIYMMNCYDDYDAYKHYIRCEHSNEIALYFTSHDFLLTDEIIKIGTYKERVSILCLY